MEILGILNLKFFFFIKKNKKKLDLFHIYFIIELDFFYKNFSKIPFNIYNEKY
jgi:hypothetical protein